MRRKILHFFKKNNLIDEQKVNSLIVSTFVYSNNIRVVRNKLINDLINYQFQKKNTLQNELLSIIQKEDTAFDLELLIQLFEYVISPNTRVINGAIYTPAYIREFIIKSLLQREPDLFLSGYKFADLSCGCGAFLIDLAQILKKKTGAPFDHIFKNNIYGIDIERYAVERAKILLTLLALSGGEDKEFEFNLIKGDSLIFDWSLCISSFTGFDYVVGNPPYVTAKHMTEETREQLSKMETCRVGNPDLYIPFFEIGIENLAINGQLGFITMNSFFKSLNARNLRQYFQEKSLDFQIIDFGAEQVFQSRNTYTCICLIRNITTNKVEYIKVKPTKLGENLNFSQIPYANLDPHNGWNLFANDLIRKIERVGIPLGKKYRTSHGLATLKNELYIFNPVAEDEQYYYLVTRQGKEYAIEKAICMPVINSNKLSREVSIEELTEQLIFPYTNDVKPLILQEKKLMTNYPKVYKYLIEHKDILASRDKGKGLYQKWYAFGRTQGLEKIKYKMFFPKYSDVIPHYLIHSDKNTYFYNGQAFLGSSVRELEILKKILETRLFWFYIKSTSKPYSSNYYSLNGAYIKNFGICDLTREEEEFILKEVNQAVLDDFFEKKYQVDLSVIDM